MEVLFTCLGGRRRRREEEEEVEKEERWRMKSKGKRRRGRWLERVQQPCLWCGAEAS